ncbi:MAG TPA: hypothetical protein VFQ91_03595 [Bryobacteraceae bacterium]|nr:hypothetical protein [Bryobacteraceae bacterium]
MAQAHLLLSLFAVSVLAESLPDGVRGALVKKFDPKGENEVRYLSASADLNGDGKPETIVYLVSRMECGTGGCPALVFTPEGKGYRLVTETSVTQTPIRLSARSSHGWRNLIVGVRGGGARGSNAELEFNGKSYPTNPTVAKRATDSAGSTLLIDNFTFEQTLPLRSGK